VLALILMPFVLPLPCDLLDCGLLPHDTLHPDRHVSLDVCIGHLVSLLRPHRVYFAMQSIIPWPFIVEGIIFFICSIYLFSLIF
jgi:hypothetical protein